MQTVEIELNEMTYETNEEIKLLRANLQFCGTDKHVLLLTSYEDNEGKSIISMELCRTLTDMGKKVLLVDIDMRKAKLICRIIGEVPDAGLSDYLSGQKTLNEVIYSSNVQGMSIIFNGMVSPNPTELLSIQRMKDLIDSARETFDYIILRCPPLGMVIDAAIIAPLCDGALIVVNSGRVKYRLVKDVADQLNTAGCPILGVILNKVNRRKRKKYKEY